jgi:hypothetical protein
MSGASAGHNSETHLLCSRATGGELPTNSSRWPQDTLTTFAARWSACQGTENHDDRPLNSSFPTSACLGTTSPHSASPIRSASPDNSQIRLLCLLNQATQLPKPRSKTPRPSPKPQGDALELITWKRRGRVREVVGASAACPARSSASGTPGEIVRRVRPSRRDEAEMEEATASEKWPGKIKFGDGSGCVEPTFAAVSWPTGASYPHQFPRRSCLTGGPWVHACPGLSRIFFLPFFVRAGCEIVTYLRLFLERKLWNTERWLIRLFLCLSGMALSRLTRDENNCERLIKQHKSTNKFDPAKTKQHNHAFKLSFQGDNRFILTNPDTTIIHMALTQRFKT